MVCIYCGSDTKVSNSRLKKRSNQIWRRRTCSVCNAVFTTLEQPLLSQSWVINSSKGKTAFLPEKFFLSIYESLKHRENAVNDAKHVTQTVIDRLNRLAADGSLDIKTLRDTAIVCLNRFDKAAATHYRAYHSD